MKTKSATPIDSETMALLRARIEAAGSSAMLAAEPGCPMSEDTILRALGGRPLQAVTRYAVGTWLRTSTTPAKAA